MCKNTQTQNKKHMHTLAQQRLKFKQVCTTGQAPYFIREGGQSWSLKNMLFPFPPWVSEGEADIAY